MLQASDPPTVSSLFQAAVDAYPHCVAVSCADEHWSYARLHERQTRWRTALLEHGIGRGQCVGVSIHRSCEVPAVILAILSVGAVYVPVDVAQPGRRLSLIASDCGLGLIIGEDCDAELAKENVLFTTDSIAGPVVRFGGRLRHGKQRLRAFAR